MNQSNGRNPYSPTTVILIAAGLLALQAAVLYGLSWFSARLISPQPPTQATATIMAPSPAQATLTLLPTVTITPTLAIPTSGCGALTLVIDSSVFQIQTLQPESDGSINMPTAGGGIAYWVDGTDVNYLFMLSPSPDNNALAATLTEGSAAIATWANCNSTTYTLSTPEQGSFDISALMDQSVSGITIFFQTDSSGAGFVVRGELSGEQINVFDTPAPGGSDIQAEISLLETTTSKDGTTIRIGITIHNFGGAAFTLSASDVALTPQDAQPLTMISSEPALPKEIAPGATETFYFTFARPSTLTATLKIFGVEYELEGY